MSAAEFHVEPELANTQLFVVTPERLDEAWDRCAHWIEVACDFTQGKLGPEDVRKSISDGTSQLFLCIDMDSRELIGTVVTTIRQYPKQRVLTLYLGAAPSGHRKKWLPHLPEFERYARDVGCAAVEIEGIPLWGEITDYAEAYRVYRKEIDHG